MIGCTQNKAGCFLDSFSGTMVGSVMLGVSSDFRAGLKCGVVGVEYTIRLIFAPFL